MSKYRIVEIAPKEFIIEKKVIETKGFLWFKKTVEYWRRVTRRGAVLFFSRFHTNAGDLCCYESLDEAKEAVSVFKRDSITYID